MKKDQSGYELYGIWKRRYYEYNGIEYEGNIYKNASGLAILNKEVGRDTLIQMMNFYFDFRQTHDINDFLFNYDKLKKEWEMFEKDQARRELLKNKTRQRILELGIELEGLEN